MKTVFDKNNYIVIKKAVELAKESNITFLCACLLLLIINRYPYNKSIPVIPFSIAFTLGGPETSSDPSIPSGLGPRIKKATAADTRTDII